MKNDSIEIAKLLDGKVSWTGDLRTQVRACLERNCTNHEIVVVGLDVGITLAQNAMIFELEGQARRDELLRLVDLMPPARLREGLEYLKWWQSRRTTPASKSFEESFFTQSKPECIARWADHRGISLPRRGKLPGYIVDRFERDLAQGIEAWSQRSR
jgi:hypothetical protein